ncbi:flagellar biosynthetic protein FliR [Sulfitobacter sp. M368]|uniref:flagellar biosynthetic protein FliR n=1 Tax=Sulfitobacter sp. M368 TaxID=2867021 RepID=UPI0021A7F355|nr:flagellar biosynthetic protein FliR [Sulfitobacter sp. M368]UWR15264.1 flagellar biosynthetic protein FliR [Sulfitobacter sp. M368]
MTPALAQLLDLTQVVLAQGFAVFVRVGALVSLMPAFGERTVPARVKLLIVIAFTVIVMPAAPSMTTPSDMSGLTLIIMTETINGLLIGIGLRMFVLALQTAGSIAAQSTSLSQILGGAVADPLPAMGYILIIGALALAAMAGLHVKAAALVILSYDLLPLGQFPGGATVSQWGVGQIRQAFGLAFTLAAPFVILSVIYNLTLGAINKAMPQLMVAFVGAPVITAGGLFILFLATPFILELWQKALDHYLASPFEVAR